MESVPPSGTKGFAMLVLSRRIGETVVIEGDIEVAIVAIHGDRVKLGIKAPPLVRVDRQEIHDLRSDRRCVAVEAV
jgi:carbon storage regulator